MPAWLDSVREILEPGPLELSAEDRWKFSCCEVLLARLGPRWISEAEAFEGLAFPHTSLFWAKELGLVEHRRRLFRRGKWIRLSGRGWEAVG